MLDVRGLQFNSYQDMVINFVPDPSLVDNPGDVNNDGKINIEDTTALINYLLTNDLSYVHTATADVDGDGAITISDVTALIGILLNQH